MSIHVREPVAAGTFYAGTPSALRRQIESCFQHPLGPGDASAQLSTIPLAIISPHAGYAYSGPVAAHAYRALTASQADLIIVIGPNHSAVGPPIAVAGQRQWRTPLGDVPVDDQAVAHLCAHSVALIDDRAHEQEHSIEVQLPFVQYVFGRRFRLLAISIHDQRLETCRRLGEALTPLLSNYNAVIVASTDFTHYESHYVATRKDANAIRAIEVLDAEGLVAAIARHGVTMCGPGAVIAAIEAARGCGATHGRLLRYLTSADTSGDYGYTVGYAALALY